MNTKNLQFRASVERPDYPDHGPVLSGGVGGTEEKQIDEKKGTTPGPALSEGSVGQDKNTRTKLPSPITQETLQTLTLKLRNTLSNPRRNMKISRRRKHQDQPKEKTQMPRRRSYQK